VENFTALHVASHAGHADLVEMLLSKYHASILICQVNYTTDSLSIRKNNEDASLSLQGVIGIVKCTCTNNFFTISDTPRGVSLLVHVPYR